MAHGGGVMVAVNAATARRQQMLLAEEESDMAKYAQDDLDGDWEFKIVRSDSGAFRKAEILNRLTEEEARAGWILLEKLDDSRIRFKSPRSARARDPFLAAGVDPYRARYGVPTPRYAALLGLLGALVLLLLGALVFYLMLIK